MANKFFLFFDRAPCGTTSWPRRFSWRCSVPCLSSQRSVCVGVGVAQWVGRQRLQTLWNQRPQFEPRVSETQEQICGSFFWVKNVVLTRCWCALTPVSIYTHAWEWSRKHVKDPVVHVRVCWIMETRKDSAITLLTEGWMYFCSVNFHSRVVPSDVHTKQRPLATGFKAWCLPEHMLQ